MPSLSVCMMAQNAENTLAIALESLGSVYDELIIVDGGSTDSTCEIASSYGAKIIHSKWTGNHSQQRNVYLKSVNTDWVFVLDYDEFIDKQTLAFLSNLKQKEQLLYIDNFWIPRKWYNPFSKKFFIASKPHYPDFQRRLFKFNPQIVYEGKIHETIYGLLHSGKCLNNLSIYHLDLLINSESKREQKVIKYSQTSPLDGMPHYYLPNINNIQKQAWSFSEILPPVQSLLVAISIKCKVCDSDAHTFAQGILLGKYEVDYFQCSNCGFIQTEEPYWLEEAYSDAIARTDVGLVFRNNNLSRQAAHIIFSLFNHDAKFLDYGGGYGLFVRMMRDLGFNFYWSDKFCTNLFAKGFEFDEAVSDSYQLVTAFEVFEHFVNPTEEIENILKFSRNVLFSTELLPENNPKPNEWWYYAPHEGQHISIYTLQTLSLMADKYDLNFYSNGSSLHLLTEKKLPPDLFNTLCHSQSEALKKKSLLQSDYSKAVTSLLNSNHQNFISVPEEITESNEKYIKVLVDGVFFQLYKTGIARVWKSLLEEWVNNGFAKHIVVLDRAGTAPKIPGVRYRLIPSYDYNATDADREILQQVCDEEGADLFISSYYTTPTTTPSVFMAYDMIPEVMGWDMNSAMWQVKHQAIQNASGYLAISENTARDLVRFFPEIPLESVKVALCGVTDNFSPASQQEVNSFKTKYGISKPYFMIVSIGGYKNTILFLEAFALLNSKQAFDIVCTGGSLLDEQLRGYTSGSTVYMLQLSDEELAIAYSGAVALVYPSKYEGFGLPVLEAIACGCPVITSPNASLPEVAGKAALYVQDDDVEGMANALCEVQKPSVRNSLIAAGLEQAKNFSWSNMAKVVSSTLINTTLLPLNLREINLIVFPDWLQPEELLGLELQRVISAIATHPDRTQITLLIDTSNIYSEDAELLLSGVTMNLLMEEDLDISEGLEISLVSNLVDIQWKALLSRLTARIILESENKQALAQVKAQNLSSYNLDSFIELALHSNRK